MATSSDSGLPQQSPLSAIPGFDPTTAFGSDGSSGSSFGGSNIDISSLPYGGNPFAGDNLFTIFNSGGVDPLTVGDPYASSGSSGISTTAASGGTPVASVGGTTTGTSDSTSTPVASDSTSTTVTTSGSNPVASVGGTTTGTSDSTSTTVASDSTSTTAGASDSTSLLQNSPLAQIPDFDPTTISVDDNPFTALATVFPNLDLSSYIGGSTATTGDSTSTTVTTSGSNPVASVSSTTTGTSDSTSITPASGSGSNSLPQQSPLSAIPGFDPTTAFGSDGSSGSSFGGSDIDISSLPYGGNPFAGDNLFTIFNSGGVDPLTVGDPYASSGSSGISTTAASGGTPVASVGGTTTGTSDSTSTTAGASDSTSLLQNSPLAQIPDFDPTTISVDDNPFTALATVFPNLDLSSYIGGSTATTGGSTSTTVTTSGSNPVASVSSTTTGTSDSTSTTGTSDSSSLLQQSPLAAIPGFDPSSISIGGNPFTGVSNTPTASDSTSTTPVSDSNQQSPFDLASAVLGNNSPFTSSSDLSSFLLNVFGQGGSPLDSNNQAIIFDGSSNPFASIGNSLANGTNPFANGGNPFAGITDNPYASGTASITAQNAPVGQFNTDVGSNNATIGNGNWSFGGDSATIGNGDWNFGNDNATIGNGNWLLNFSSNNTTLGNGNWYRNSSNNNETLGNGNWDFGSNDATIGNGNWDFGTNNTVIGNGNWIFTSNTTVIGNGNLLSPSGNSSSVGTFVPGLETSVDSLISSLVGNFGQDFVELTGNLDSADLQTLDQLILSKAGNNLLAQKPQPVPEPGFSADIAVLGIALLLWLSFKKWFPLQKLAFRMSK